MEIDSQFSPRWDSSTTFRQHSPTRLAGVPSTLTYSMCPLSFHMVARELPQRAQFWSWVVIQPRRVDSGIWYISVRCFAHSLELLGLWLFFACLCTYCLLFLIVCRLAVVANSLVFVQVSSFAFWAFVHCRSPHSASSAKLAPHR